MCIFKTEESTRSESSIPFHAHDTPTKRLFYQRPTSTTPKTPFPKTPISLPSVPNAQTPTHPPLPLRPPPPHRKRTPLRRPIPIQTQQAHKVQRKEPDQRIPEPALPPHHPLQPAQHPVAPSHRPGRRTRRAKRIPLGLEVHALRAGRARRVGGRLAHRGRQRSRVRAAHGIDDGAGFED